MDTANTADRQPLNNSVIMMLDDEPIIIDLIQIFLEDLGYTNFTGLTNSATAVEKIVEGQPDLLFLDLVMPEVDGFEVLAKLRSNEATQHLPVIVLTSSSDAQSKLRALELGATDFLAKPVNESELALRLRNILTVKAYQNQLMYYDSLTGLPNRKLCQVRLGQNLAYAEKKQHAMAVLNLNLYGLRTVLDSFGSSVCDKLLKQVAAELLECVRASDVVAFTGNDQIWRGMSRVGDDEFLIVLSGLRAAGEATFVASRLLSILKVPMHLEQHDIQVNACVGISTYPEDGRDPEALMQSASQAASEARLGGHYQVQFFSSDENLRLRDRMRLESDLRRALVDESFYLAFQPQLDARTRKVVGAETLLRWTHPERGPVSPADFIPVAESSGLMEDLGHWVFKTACRQAAQWHLNGTDVSVSINVSSQQFNSGNFIARVRECLEETGVNPAMVMVELTESIAVSNVESNIRILHELKSLGLELSVDDFGTGYSSLRYIKDFPLDEIKIDKAFIDGLPAQKGDVAIVSAILMMARRLGMKVVAEGVENVDQYEYLVQQDCDEIQGYFFSRPLNAEDFETFCAQCTHRIAPVF